jgi:hypothetical protein
MKNFILFLAVVCGAMSFVLLTVAKEGTSGPGWAMQMCKTTGSLCHNPQYLAFVAAAFAALWIVMIFVSAIRD